MRYWLDRAAGWFEYFVAFLFLQGAWNVVDEPAVDTPFAYLDPLATRVAIVSYAGFFVILAAALIGAKVANWTRVHGYTLMGMYLTALYIVILAIMIDGWNNGLYFSVFIICCIGALYVRWRYKVIFQRLKE